MNAPAAATVLAGGAVVHRRSGDGSVEYAVVHRPRYDDWSLPKGKVDAGESVAAAAAREVKEETGWSCRPGPLLGSVAYRTGAGMHKLVRYWLMEAAAGEFTANSEVDELAWLTAAEARERLTYARDRAVLAWGAELAADPARATIYLVRHASAGRRDLWDGDDRERPVQGDGWAEVEWLTDTLSGLPVARVLTSPYLRCSQTVAPLAAALDLELEEEPALVEGAPAAFTRRLIEELAGTAAVLCSHGDVVSNVVGAAAAGGAVIAGGLQWEKGSVWVLSAVAGRVAQGRYLPPPSV